MKMTPRFKKSLVATALGFVIIFCGLLVVVYQYMNTPVAVTDKKNIFLVEPGSSFTTITKKLYKDNILSCPELLSVYARLTNRTVIRAGEYLLSDGMTPLQILSALNAGDVVRHQLTLVEGRTFKQAVQVLVAEKKLRKNSVDFSEQALIELLGVDGNNLEGMLFPDTYQYTIDSSDLDVLREAHKKLKRVLEEEWASRESNLPYKNSYEALIMASIIEKETGAPEERAEIAGVFVRRLQKGMKLQTDPTVIYGLGDSYTGNVTRKHLLQDTPYNTYTRLGLPPTPIALAGREAIHAALHPQSGDTLFFVGKGDGRHYFSATLAEHEKAVRQFQLTRIKNYRSSPDQNGKGVKPL